MSQKTIAADIAGSYDLAMDGLGHALQQAIAARQPAMVWGPPGVGKSMVAEAVAAELGMHYIDVRPALMQPVDLLGLPWRNPDTGRTEWASPAFLPDSQSEDSFLINLEELVSAQPTMQAAMYQLVLDRRLGDYRLPPGAHVIACGNRESDRGVVYRMPTPLRNRFVHLTVRADIEAWSDWALREGLSTEIIFFLQFRPELLMRFDPRSADNAFPSPRSWQFASNLVAAGNCGNGEIEMAMLAGTVGEGAAVEFASFLEVYRSLPHPDSVFTEPLTVEIPSEPSALIALCGAVCSRVDEQKMDSVAKFCRRDDLRMEVGQFLMDSCAKRDPGCRFTSAYTHWVAHVGKSQ